MRSGFSRITHHASRITHHASRITPHASRITPHASRLAFTLIELLMVIAIMGILAAIALPAVRGLKPNAKAAATRQLLDAVTRARQLALSQRTTVYMVFVPSNFWSDSAYNYAAWTTNDQTLAESLFDKQLLGYAYVCLRSVGDQPAMHTARYLSPWRALVQGAYISPEKFTPAASLTAPARLVLQILTNGVLAHQVYGFNYTTSVPFPSETTKPASDARPYVALPYIAFDGMGQLKKEVSGSKPLTYVPSPQPELIPVSEGVVTFPRNPESKVALKALPQVTERPAGNTTNNYSLVSIDGLTGHARVERTKVQ